MMNILLVSSEKRRFLDMITAFQAADIRVDHADSGEKALNGIADNAYHVLIADESLSDMTARELIEKTVSLDPSLNCVAVSSLSRENFHDRYEGMGVLMQFPEAPGPDDVKRLLMHLDKIQALSRKHYPH